MPKSPIQRSNKAVKKLNSNSWVDEMAGKVERFFRSGKVSERKIRKKKFVTFEIGRRCFLIAESPKVQKRNLEAWVFQVLLANQILAELKYNQDFIQQFEAHGDHKGFILYKDFFKKEVEVKVSGKVASIHPTGITKQLILLILEADEARTYPRLKAIGELIKGILREDLEDEKFKVLMVEDEEVHVSQLHKNLLNVVTILKSQGARKPSKALSNTDIAELLVQSGVSLKSEVFFLSNHLRMATTKQKRLVSLLILRTYDGKKFFLNPSIYFLN